MLLKAAIQPDADFQRKPRRTGKQTVVGAFIVGALDVNFQSPRDKQALLPVLRASPGVPAKFVGWRSGRKTFPETKFLRRSGQSGFASCLNRSMAGSKGRVWHSVWQCWRRPPGAEAVFPCFCLYY